jgi:hypothetical protein
MLDTDQIINDPNCIIRAFEKTGIAILKIEETKYYFSASD